MSEVSGASNSQGSSPLVVSKYNGKFRPVMSPVKKIAKPSPKLLSQLTFLKKGVSFEKLLDMLLQRYDEVTVLKISNHKHAIQLFNIFVDDDNYEKLTSLLSPDEIDAALGFEDALRVFEILIDDELSMNLFSRVSKSVVVKAACTDFGGKILDSFIKDITDFVL